MDKNNRFMKILRDAEALRKIRRKQREEQMKALRDNAQAGTTVDYTPTLDKPIPYERREYIHKLVKEVLSKD